MTAKIRVLLAEDQAMVRGALMALLRLEPDLEIVGEVSEGKEVLLAAIKSQPDVALLDIEMPGGDGLDAAQALHKNLPSCRIVILTTFGRSGARCANCLSRWCEYCRYCSTTLLI